jgi:hypothetical protein
LFYQNLQDALFQKIFLAVLQEDFGDSKHEVGIRVLGCLFFGAELDFDSALLLILKVLDQLLASPYNILLEEFVDESFVLRL